MTILFYSKRIASLVVPLVSLLITDGNAFTTSRNSQAFAITTAKTSRPFTTTKSTPLRMSSDENDGQYTQKLLLREEAENPFRKVRFFLYASTIVGALTSLAVSGTRVAAAAAGVNTDLMQESLTNVGVDIAGIVVLAFFFKRDLDAQEEKLKRAQRGADLAKLVIRVNDDSGSYTKALSDFRSGRGIDKRIIIAAAGRDKIEQIMVEADRLSSSLEMNDLIVVPIVYPQYAAPVGVAEKFQGISSIALPAGGNWRGVVGDEAEVAATQGIDVDKDGVCIILKKNGRVGQRTRGVNLAQMVGEVSDRRDKGMDVKNI